MKEKEEEEGRMEVKSEDGEVKTWRDRVALKEGGDGCLEGREREEGWK